MSSLGSSTLVVRVALLSSPGRASLEFLMNLLELAAGPLEGGHASRPLPAWALPWAGPPAILAELTRLTQLQAYLMKHAVVSESEDLMAPDSA